MPNRSLCRHARFRQNPGNGVPLAIYSCWSAICPSLAKLFTELAQRPESGIIFARPSAPVTLCGIPWALISGLHTARIFQPLLRTLTQVEYSACLSPLSEDFYMILRNWSVKRRIIWFKDNLLTYAAILKICPAIGNENQSTVNLYYVITFLELPRSHDLWSAAEVNKARFSDHSFEVSTYQCRLSHN